jgi:hypothetical protein
MRATIVTGASFTTLNAAEGAERETERDDSDDAQVCR